MLLDYPRCPQCHASLVKLPRLSSLIKKIHDKMHGAEISVPTTTASVLLRRYDLRSSQAIDKLKLPEKVAEILTKHRGNNKHKNQTDLFLKVLNLFHDFGENAAVHRDRIVQVIYERVVKKDSIFFTVQQWLDLENEYNRLRSIDYLAVLQSRAPASADSLDLDTLDDILFGPNRFEPLALTMFQLLLGEEREKDDGWKSIHLEELDWPDLQRDRRICDGKWFVCPEGE